MVDTEAEVDTVAEEDTVDAEDTVVVTVVTTAPHEVVTKTMATREEATR